MTIETLAIDIAKKVFQLHGVNRNGRVVLSVGSCATSCSRSSLGSPAPSSSKPAQAHSGGRAVRSAWTRREDRQPANVKPFVRRQKNDGNDAEAICTAARQPHIPFVPKKTVEQQDIQALHRARQRMVNHRTAVVSQMRGLLLDRGFPIAKSITCARRLHP